jgi:hypothetical protein
MKIKIKIKSVELNYSKNRAEKAISQAPIRFGAKLE